MMAVVSNLFSSSVAQAFGWTLVNSLWQAFLCTIAIVIVLRCLPQRLSTVRYAVAAVGLFGICLISIGTFIYLITTPSESVAASHSTIYHTVAYQTNAAQYSSVNEMSTRVTLFIQSNISFIILLWSIGAFLFSIRVGGGWWYVKNLRDSAIPIQDHWSERVRRLARQLGINQVIKLAESTRIQAPIVIGYFKPVILMPAGMCLGLTTDQVESIFIHELIHIRRRDFLVNIIQSFLEGIYFFNPFVWILSGIMRREREHCCDDGVVAVHGNPLAYARALASLEEARLSPTGVALSLTENKKELLNRIKRIMEKSVHHYSRRERLAPALLLVIGLFCASWITIQSGTLDTGRIEKMRASDIRPVAADTTIKNQKAARYSQKKTTSQVDGQIHDEITEEFDGDEEMRPLMEAMAFDFGTPMEPFAPLEIMQGHVSPLDFNLMIPIDLADFKMDTIPFPPALMHDGNWEEFNEVFEKNFQENFGDFYFSHGDELREMMNKISSEFESHFDPTRIEQMTEKVARQAEFARAHVDQLAIQKELLARQAESMKTVQENLMRVEESRALDMKDLEKKMKKLEESMKVIERELKEQLVKDGYLKEGEKVENINMHDGTIEINGKTIKQKDQKKYEELMHKHSAGLEDWESQGRRHERLD